MGFRFRKTKKIGPARITISKKGIGFSLGVKGAKVSRGADGKIRGTLSIPGSGISFTKILGKKKR